MTLTQSIVLIKSFTEAQFGYCPLVGMFRGRVLNRKTNHLHERSLRNVYRDSISSFQELLKKDHSFTIHHRNIQSLAIELYKIKKYLSNEIKSSIFPPTNIHKIFENNYSFHIMHYEKNLIFVFQGFSASIDNIFILAGGLGTRLSFYEV